MPFIAHPDQTFGGRTYSQNGEDLLILNIFKALEIKNPSYIDVGAHHPENISNTKLLYDLGSRGVNIDANPNLQALFDERRPFDKNIMGVGVGGSQEGTFDYHMLDDYSGRNTFSQDEVVSNRDKYGYKYPKSISIRVRPLDFYIRQYFNGIWPAFLSLDAEGLDYDIIKGSSFVSHSGPLVVCVESRPGASLEMVRLMKREKDYFPLTRMGDNLIFIRSGILHQIWGLGDDDII